MPISRLTALDVHGVATQPIGNTTIADVASRQLRVAIQRRGDETRLIPQTAAAERWIGGTDAAHAHQLLQGIDALARARGAAIHGVTFTTSQRGFAASTVLDETEHELLPAARRAHLSPNSERLASEDFAESSLESMKFDAHALAINSGGWLTFAPGMSRRLVHPERAASGLSGIKDALRTVAHEIEHSVTPSSKSTPQQDHWEEAIAETLAAWPGNDAATSRHLGIGYRRTDISNSGYDGDVRGLRQLLRLAGVDTSRSAGLADARLLLQAPALSRAPGNVLDAILTHQGITVDARRREPLRQMIRDGISSPSIGERVLRELRT